MFNLLRIAIFVAGLGGGGLLFHAYNVFVDNPSIVRFERERAADLAEAAAAKATRDEQLRQFRLGERAAEAAIKAERDAAEWHAAELEILKEEIADYEAERALGGRACRLDRRDLDFLGGVLERSPRELNPGGR